MNKLKAIVLGIIGFLLIGTPVLAAIAAPTTQTINTIEAYRSVIHTNDQLYIVTFSLDYAVNPTDNARVNFLFRFSDNGTQIVEVAPSPYFDSGYDDGIISFYFLADDPNIPDWSTANLSVEFTGNPSLDWGGDPPSVTNNVVDTYTDDNQLIPARIRVLASALETQWGIDLIELLSGTLVLTAFGEEYFEAVIPNLRIIAPDVFSSVTLQPEFDEREFTNTYATTAEDRWVGDPIFDTTPTAIALGIPRVWLNSIIWVGVSIGMMVAVIMAVRRVRPASYIFGATLVIGSFAGFMTFVGGIFVGVIGALAIVFSILYKNAP